MLPQTIHQPRSAAKLSLQHSLFSPKFHFCHHKRFSSDEKLLELLRCRWSNSSTLTTFTTTTAHRSSSSRQHLRCSCSTEPLVLMLLSSCLHRHTMGLEVCSSICFGSLSPGQALISQEQTHEGAQHGCDLCKRRSRCQQPPGSSVGNSSVLGVALTERAMAMLMPEDRASQHPAVWAVGSGQRHSASNAPCYPRRVPSSSVPHPLGCCF